MYGSWIWNSTVGWAWVGRDWGAVERRDALSLSRPTQWGSRWLSSQCEILRIGRGLRLMVRVQNQGKAALAMKIRLRVGVGKRPIAV